MKGLLGPCYVFMNFVLSTLSNMQCLLMLKSCLFFFYIIICSFLHNHAYKLYLFDVFLQICRNKPSHNNRSQLMCSHSNFTCRASTIISQHTMTFETRTSLTRLSFTALCVSARRHFKVLHKSDNAWPDSKRSSAEKLFKTYQLIVADCCKFSFDVGASRNTTFGNSNQEVTQVGRAQRFQATGRSLRTKTVFVMNPRNGNRFKLLPCV